MTDVQAGCQGFADNITVPVYNLYFIVTHRFWILGLLTLRTFQIDIYF